MKLELFKAVLTCLSSLIVVAAGWLVGQRLTFSWNMRQKQRELQLASVQQFYAAYGEFFVVWKLWNRLDREAAGADDKRWDLQKRAAAAEAIVEGLLVKLSSEAELSDDQIRSLGRFRQAFQQLRQCIRLGRILDWPNSDSAPYVTFKRLAVEIAQLLAGEWPHQQIGGRVASDQILAITNHQWELVWEREFEN